MKRSSKAISRLVPRKSNSHSFRTANYSSSNSLQLSKIKNRTTLRPPLNSASSWKLVESWKEASNFTGVRQLGQVIIFTGSGTRPTTSKLKPFFPCAAHRAVLWKSAAQDQACVQTRDAASRLHGYVHLPSAPAGSADVARSRRCRLSSLRTGAAPGRLPCGADVRAGWPRSRDPFSRQFFPLHRSSVDRCVRLERENGRRGKIWFWTVVLVPIPRKIATAK